MYQDISGWTKYYGAQKLTAAQKEINNQIALTIPTCQKLCGQK